MMKITALSLILILSIGCSRKPCPKPFCPVLLDYDCNITVETNKEGGFDSENALKLMDCYSDMKYYYRTRDKSYNALFGEEE